MERRELTVAPAAGTQPCMFLSAASGLVCLHDTLYVVADDALDLGVFPLTTPEPGRLVRLFDGTLPDEKTERKRLKPDLEALVHIPSFEAYPYGAMLALGSGSRENRRRGALLALGAAGRLSGTPLAVDLTPLLAPLSGMFPDINIEGAVVAGDELRLIQRGNNARRENAVVSYPLARALRWLLGKHTGMLQPSGVNRLDLGMIDSVSLGVTDATMLPDGRMAFSAVAEDTEDAYRDGLCVGAAVGIVDTDGHLVSLEQLERPYKVEGISIAYTGGHPELLLVTDADDPATPALLLSMPLGSLVA